MPDPWGKLQQSKVRAMARNIGTDPSAMLVFCALISQLCNDTGTASMSQRSLCEMLGLSRPTIKRCLALLVSKGLIAVDSPAHGRADTVYRFPDQRWVK